MKKTILISVLIFLFTSIVWSQSESYQKKKAQKVKKESVFTKIIKKELPATIVYENDDVIAFAPLRLQAPTHLLSVPRKEIPTINDILEGDALVLGAKKLAKEKGISETGYRLSMNSNEDASQSVFHVHMHLLGGQKLGSMLSQKN